MKLAAQGDRRWKIGDREPTRLTANPLKLQLKLKLKLKLATFPISYFLSAIFFFSHRAPALNFCRAALRRGHPISYLLSTIFFCQPLLAEDWQRALQPRSWQFPRDHGAHPEFKTEWWYLTGNLQDASGNPYGYQLTFFRHGLQPIPTQTGSAWAVRDIYFGHLTVTDGQANRFHFAEKLSRGALGEADFATNDCSVQLGDWTLRRTQKSIFEMKAWAPEEKFGLELAAQPLKPIVFQGNAGLSQKSATPGNASHYYSYTRMETKGELRIGDRRIPVSGLSWLDREFSTSALGQNQEGWDEDED